ncbi:MAG: zinc-binding dehydrogenase [Halobacteriota archaeon]|nr:zinc-binding dehydrogenase [Halobacteriota archaeon]
MPLPQSEIVNLVAAVYYPILRLAVRKARASKNRLHCDLILDMAAYHSIFDYKRALGRNGSYVVEGGSMFRVFQVLILGPLVSMIWRKKMGVLMHKQNKDLDHIIDLFEGGKIVPVIDKRYQLSEVPEALRYFGEGHARGKIVVTVACDDETQ